MSKEPDKEQFIAYTAGSEVFWRTPFGDWFKGIVREQRGDLVHVDRVSPPGAWGLLLEVFLDEYGIPGLKPAVRVDYAVWEIRAHNWIVQRDKE